MVTRNKDDMTEEKIYIGIDNERIELTGQAKADFLADRQQFADQLAQAEADKVAKAQAKAAAQAKLAALGLTTDDLTALGL
jgi:hypothetical protein